MTALDIVCGKHRCKWTVKGEFVRHLLSNIDHTYSSMTICLTWNTYETQRNIDKFRRVMHDLELLKYIDGSTKKDIHGNTTLYNASNNQFVVAFVCGNKTVNCFDIDNIVFTRHGITFEDTQGVRFTELVESLSRIKDKKIKRMIRYGTDHMTNGELLLTENMMIKEGYTVSESPLFFDTLHLTNDCPICYEVLQYIPYTTIGCGHSMCMNCLGLHMSKRGDNHSKCPLCRTKIFLRT